MSKDLPPFFESLHRPFHQPLKTSRWVCEFFNSRKTKTSMTSSTVDFYLFLINKLQILYSKDTTADYPGLISRYAVSSVTSHLKNLSKAKKNEAILKILRNPREKEVEKQIYSTYKAASYYINLAKDKLKLIDNNYYVSDFGKQLLSIKSKSSPTILSIKESEFFFFHLVSNDFLLLISLCLFKRLEFIYKFTDTENRYFDFINKMYRIKHFRYNRQSLSNYNKVRSSWIDAMNVMDKRNIIRIRFRNIISTDECLNNWYNDITKKLDVYEKESFRVNRDYEILKAQFVASYKLCILQKKDVLGFVNLYDVKQNIRISHLNYEKFINTFYETEKARSHIFFSNIVSSIDRRKRFKVRGVSVLKIKYKWK